MDDEFEDLLGEGDAAAQDEDVGVQKPSVMFDVDFTISKQDEMLPSTPVPQDLPPPSENELRLGRKVLQLEKERDSISAELQAIKARFPAHSSTLPVPTSPSPTQLLTIPHELLPTLSLLRHHIAELTRDNEALRYTLLGGPVASSSKVTLDTPQAQRLPGGVLGVDLSVVVGRVKELIRENEELGEMVLEAGRGSSGEWQKALDESKAVITSLDSDLAHHLTVVQSIRSELVAYKTHFGPLPSRAPKKDGDAGPSSSSDKPMDLGRDRDRDRDRDKGDRPAGASMNGGNDGDRRHDESVAPFTRHQDRRRDTPNGGNNRDRDRQRDDARRPNGLPSGSGRKEEDREYKRRR